VKLLLLLLAGLLPASAIADEPPAATGVLTKAPSVLHGVDPVWPQDALAEGRTGEVLLDVDVSETGEVQDARVVKSAGAEFDTAALDAIRQFRFDPAEVDGKPTAVTIQYRFAFVLRAPPAQASPEVEADKPVDLRGVVLQRGNREPVAGALVDVGEGAFSAVTDAQGRFAIAGIPPGEVKVVVVATAYRRFETTETITAGKVTEVKYYPLKEIDSPFQTLVTTEAEKKEVSQVEVSAQEIRRLPGISGDAVKVVLNLPGVARSAYDSGQLVVRGGNPQDTKVYVDGEEVPLIFHFGGIRSVYASELIDQVEFEAGNFGVRYGRAIAGRVELRTRLPDMKRLHLVADANLYDALGFVEGPFASGVAGAVAVRRSYVDAILPLVLNSVPDPPNVSVAPRYFDYQGKLAWKPSDRDTLRLDMYGSSDRLAVIDIRGAGVDTVSRFSTLTYFSRIALQWDRVVSPETRLHASVTPGFDRVKFDAPPFVFGVDAWRVDARFDAYHDFSRRFTLGTGLDLQLSHQIVGAQLPAQPPPGRLPPPSFSQNLIDASIDILAAAPGLWVEAVTQPVDGLKLIPGVRFDHDSYLGASWIDPRLAARWALAEGSVVKGGIGLYHQAPLPQYSSREFGNPDLPPEGSVQYMVGLEQHVVATVSLDLQLYWKTLFDLATQVNGPERYAPRGGRSYGAELLLRYDPDGRFFGWIAYSLSRTERDVTDVSGFSNNGDRYDQPSNLIALGSWEIPELWHGLSAGFRLRWVSGNPRTRVQGSVYDVDADEYRQIPFSARRGRFPPFAQLDLRVDKKWTFETSTLTVYLDILNVTNRKNSEGVSYNYDFTREDYVPGIPFFPSLGLRFEY
jgi:TonB family protein